ncbi:MAG: hypothetical protein NVS4B2_29840 [Chloroflexota bacterium]
MRTIRALVVDDHPAIRELVPVVLMADSTISVVGESVSGREVLDQVTTLRPDVVIMDLAMPELDGVETTRLLLEGNRTSAVVILTTSEDRSDVHRSIEAGAKAYVLKRTMARDLVTAVRSALDGIKYVSPSLREREEGTAVASVRQESRMGSGHGQCQ